VARSFGFMCRSRFSSALFRCAAVSWLVLGPVSCPLLCAYWCRSSLFLTVLDVRLRIVPSCDFYARVLPLLCLSLLWCLFRVVLGCWFHAVFSGSVLVVVLGGSGAVSLSALSLSSVGLCVASVASSVRFSVASVVSVASMSVCVGSGVGAVMPLRRYKDGGSALAL